MDIDIIPQEVFYNVLSFLGPSEELKIFSRIKELKPYYEYYMNMRRYNFCFGIVCANLGVSDNVRTTFIKIFINKTIDEVLNYIRENPEKVNLYYNTGGKNNEEVVWDTIACIIEDRGLKDDYFDGNLPKLKKYLKEKVTNEEMFKYINTCYQDTDGTFLVGDIDHVNTKKTYEDKYEDYL